MLSKGRGSATLGLVKVHLGKVPEAPDFDPEAEGYRPIRELSAAWTSVLGSVLGIALAAGVGLLSGPVIPPASEWLPTPSDIDALEAGLFRVAILFIPVVGAIIVVHELIHFAVYPSGSERGVGLWPSKLLFYAYYMGTLSRERFLLAFALPFVVLSLLPVLVLWGLGVQSGLAVALVVLHAVLCGGDLIGFVSVAVQIPRGARVRNKGWLTYWQPRDA